MAKYDRQVSALVELRVRDALDALADDNGLSFAEALRLVIDFGLTPAAEFLARKARIAVETSPEPDVEMIRAARRG
jgi:hypothetical protein